MEPLKAIRFALSPHAHFIPNVITFSFLSDSCALKFWPLPVAVNSSSTCLYLIYEQCKMFLILLDAVTNIGADALCSGNKKNPKMGTRLVVQETKEKKARKKAKQRNWSCIKDLFNQIWQHSSNTQYFEQNFKYVSCQTGVKSLSDLLDRELNKPDLLFHLKTDLFHKAFLWNILDHTNS